MEILNDKTAFAEWNKANKGAAEGESEGENMLEQDKVVTMGRTKKKKKSRGKKSVDEAGEAEEMGAAVAVAAEAEAEGEKMGEGAQESYYKEKVIKLLFVD